ncbi:MAG: hypothetical protein Q4B86_05350 [Eubacteriales bacterium]|nr:hypothetical protein [Eubacteriales bacterium]
MTNKADKNQRIGLIAMLAVCAILVFAGDPIYNALARNKEAAKAALNDGSYTSEIELEDGSKSIVNMTLEGGDVKNVSWDVENADGSLKSDLSKAGQYVMTETGLKWHEQSELLSKYVVDNNTDENIAINEEGKIDGEIDGLSGVSIDIKDFKNGIDDCFNQAASNS